MTLYEAYKQVRSEYNSTSALADLRHVRSLLKSQARHRFDLSDDPQTLTHKGFFVVVKVQTDEDHSWDDDTIGTIYGYGEHNEFQDVADNGYASQFTFESNQTDELVGFDLGGGETFASLLEYCRGRGMSKQVAFEEAMRMVKAQFKYALEWEEARHDRYNDNFWAYGVVTQVYESEEAYCEDEEPLAESSTWGIEVDTRQWKEAQEYISERAWDCIHEAIYDAQRAKFDKLQEAGNVPLFEGA